MNFVLQLDDVHAALSGAPADCVSSRFLTEHVAQNSDQQDVLEVDMDDHWMDVLQDIVRGSTSLAHIAIETAHTCSRMLFDGFGSQAILITAQAIDSMSTSQFIDDALNKMAHGAQDSSTAGILWK